MEFVRADASARYQRLLGKEVFFNTGTDEHGFKIYQKAIEHGIDVQTYVDTYALRFKDLLERLNISYTRFIRTTDADHQAAAQEFWIRCRDNGDIYKAVYKVKYCVGCELEKTESDLVDGKCPDHPKQELEEREEENYFFRFSKYQKPLLDVYAAHPDFVLPDFRFNEIKAFVERGLADFSISRLTAKMPWGVSVPEDPAHSMYVWFDALVNYVSTLGWPTSDTFETYWPVVQYAGKDNLRQQSAMWQAMLLSAGLQPSKQIIINGHILGEGGVKMSKSIGNVINPFDVLDTYGTDAFRYFFLREVSSFEDSEFSWDKIKESYNANLANGLGNLTSRIMKMAVSYDVPLTAGDMVFDIQSDEYANIRKAIESYNHTEAMDLIWERIKVLDTYVTVEEPFKKIKTDKAGAEQDLVFLQKGLYAVASLLAPYMPDTSDAIVKAIESHSLPPSLFVRKA